MKFLFKVVVASVAVYGLNEYYKQTKILEKLVEAGGQLAKGFLEEYVQSQQTGGTQ